MLPLATRSWSAHFRQPSSPDCKRGSCAEYTVARALHTWIQLFMRRSMRAPVARGTCCLCATSVLSTCCSALVVRRSQFAAHMRQKLNSVAASGFRSPRRFRRSPWGFGEGGNEMVGPRSTEVIVDPFRTISCVYLPDRADICIFEPRAPSPKLQLGTLIYCLHASSSCLARATPSTFSFPSHDCFKLVPCGCHTFHVYLLGATTLTITSHVKVPNFDRCREHGVQSKCECCGTRGR